MNNIEKLTESKYLIIRHVGYFIGGIGLIHLSVVLFLFTIIISIFWYYNEGFIAFKATWKEYFKLLHKIWLKK